MSSKRSPPSGKRPRAAQPAPPFAPRAHIIAPPHARHRAPAALQHLPLHALPPHWRAAFSPPPPAPPRIPAPHPPAKPAPAPNHNTRTPDTIQDPAVYDPRAYNPNAPLLTPAPSPLLFSPGPPLSHPAPTRHAHTDLTFSYSVTPTNVWHSQTLIPTQPHDSQLRAIPPSARAASQGPTLSFSHFAPQMPPRNQTPTASFPLSTPPSTSGPILIQRHDHPTNPSDFPAQSTPQTDLLSPNPALTDIPHSATLHPVFSPNFPPSVMCDPYSSPVFQSFAAPPSPPQPHIPAPASPPKHQLQRNSFCRKPKRRKASSPNTTNTCKPVDRPLPDPTALDLFFSHLMPHGGLPLITPQPESPRRPNTPPASQTLSPTPQLQSQKHSSLLSHPPTQSHAPVPQIVAQQPPYQEDMDDDVPLVRPGSRQRPLSVSPTARVKMSVKKWPAKKVHVARQRKGSTLPTEGKKAAQKSFTSVPLVTSENPSAIANDQTTTPAKKTLTKKTIAKKARGKGQRREKVLNAEKKKGNKPPLDCPVGMNQKLSPVVENQTKAPAKKISPKKISPKKNPAKKTLAKKAQVKGRQEDYSLGPKKKIVKTSVLDLALTKSKKPSSASGKKSKKTTKKSLPKKARVAADRKDATSGAEKKAAKKSVAPMSPGARPKPLPDTSEQTLKLVPTSPSQNVEFTSHRTCGPLSTTNKGARSSESPMSVGVKSRKLSSVSNEKKKFGALSPHKRPQERDIVDRTGVYDVSCNLSAMDEKSASLERPTNIDCVSDAPIEELQISKVPRVPTPICLRPSSSSQKDIDWSMMPAPTNAGWPKLSLPSPAVPQKTLSSSNSRRSAQGKLDSGIQLPNCLDNARPTLRSTLLTTDKDILTRGMKKARTRAACNTRGGAVDSKQLPSDEKIPSGDKIESGPKCSPPEEGKDKAFSSCETLPSFRSKDSEADMTQADIAQSPGSISEEQDDELEANAHAAKLGCESTVVQRRKPEASEPLRVSTAEDAQETTDTLKCIFVKLPLRDPARAARRLLRTAKKDMLEKDGTKAAPIKRPRLRNQPAKKAAKAAPKGGSISKGKGSHPPVPKKGKASSKGTAATKVHKSGIAKGVPPRVSRGKPALRLKLRDRGKKVTMLEDVHTDDPPSSSRVPSIKSSQPKQTLIHAGNTTEGDAPHREPALEVEKEVRRSARVTRDAPTLEQILGSGNIRSPIMPPEELLSKMRKLKCSLCLSSIEIGDEKKHPFFRIRSLHLCETCHGHISTSSHAFAAISSGALSGEHCGPWKQSSALAFATEGLVRNLRPSERRNAELVAAHDRIVLQSKESLGKRVEALSVPLEMIAIIQLLLSEIGVAFKAGGMVWPEDTISLPENDDTRSMISNVLPLSLDDIRSGRSAGERAWESVFGEKERCDSLTSCAIFGKVLDLVGVATEHVGGCGGNTSDGSAKCCVRVDQTSVKAVSSWASKSSTATHCIVTERPDDVTDEHLGHHEICCVCILPLVPATFPFRYTKCGGCHKTFCSVCLSNVLGSSEYVRALCEDSYSCVGCRWKQKQRFLAKGQWGLKSISSTKKTTTVTEDRRSTLPLLLLSSPIRKKLHQVRNHKKLQFEIRFAQLCDALNYQGCTSHHVQDKRCSPKPICFQCCSLDSDDTGTESTESGLSRAPFVTCSGKKCSTVMHRHCVEGYKPSKTRGRSGMVCKQHKCSVCAGRDEARLVRCRTCPVTYCRDHAPPAPEIHIYSDKFIACPTCKPYLHFPQMSTQRPPPLPKRISHANNIAISFALDQRQRQAEANRAVSKLYDGEDKMYSPIY